MAKTFYNISEASATNYLFLFAQRTLAHQNEPPTPPPLNVVGLPCEAICQLWAWMYPKKAGRNKYLCFFYLSTGTVAAETVAAVTVAAETGANNLIEVSPASPPTSPPETAVAVAAVGAEASEATLAEKITEYIVHNQDDAAQENRWRDMTKSFKKVKEEVQKVESGVQKVMEEVKEEVQKVKVEVKAGVQKVKEKVKAEVQKVEEVLQKVEAEVQKVEEEVKVEVKAEVQKVEAEVQKVEAEVKVEVKAEVQKVKEELLQAMQLEMCSKMDEMLELVKSLQKEKSYS